MGKIIQYLLIAMIAFVFACEDNDLLRATKLGISFYGDSDSVGVLVAALVGALRGGDVLFEKKKFQKLISPLENSEKLISLSKRISKSFDDK